jgi:osmotically-inducible protein OsmY
MNARQFDALFAGVKSMNTLTKKVLAAGALIVAASAASAQTTPGTITPPRAYDIESTPQDQRITQEVEQKIANDPRLEGDIGVETVNGKVTLKGTLETSEQVSMAQDDAASVDGVRDVDAQAAARVGKNF